MASPLILKLLVQNAGFQKELAKSQKDFQKFTKNLLGDAQGFKRIGAELKSFGTSASIAVTAPLVAASVGFVKVASDFESAFTGVKKTVTATEEEYAALADGIRKMAMEIPASTTAIAGVAEAAGQLGISKENILSFTRTMIDLGNTTNVSAQEAAVSLARFANITKLPEKEISNLASTVVELGNNLATTEQEIIAMSLRMAASAKIVGFLESDTLALAGAMSSVGIEAEAGGTAMSKVMIKLAKVIQVPGEELDKFAAIAGQTSKEFQKSFETDAAKALATFIEGLDKMARSGEDVFTVLEDMELAEVRVQRALLSAAGAGDLLRTSIDLGREAWEKNIALTKEADLRYQTFEKQLVLVKNKINDIGITLGTELIPVLLKFLDKTLKPLIADIASTVKSFSQFDEATKNIILSIGLFAAALGPLIIALGLLISALQTLIPLFMIGGTLSIGLASIIKAVKALSVAALGPTGIIVALVAMTVWTLKASGEWDKLTEAIKKSNAQIVENIEKFGSMKVAMALVLNFLNLNILGYQHYLDLLSAPEGVEGVEALTGAMNENKTAASTAMFALKSGADLAIESVDDLIDIEGSRQKFMARTIIKEAQLDQQRRRRQEALGRLWQKVGEQMVAATRRAGREQEIIGLQVLTEAQQNYKAQQVSYDESLELQRLAASGVATVLKGIWGDVEVTAGDAFKNAANIFIDVMAQMVVEAIITGTAISVSMASATAGISLVIGLLGSVFGGSKKKGKTELQKATEDFLKEIKRTIKAFENEILTVLEKTTINAERNRESLSRIILAGEAVNAALAFRAKNITGESSQSVANRARTQRNREISRTVRENARILGVAVNTLQNQFNIPGFRAIIVANAKESIGLIKDEFKIKKAAALEIMSILKQQDSFTKDIDKTIIGVRRAFFSTSEIFEAQKKDIQDLTGLVAVASGETKLQLAGELKQALLDSFETAKTLFEGDPVRLKSWQDRVLAGLDGVKDSGKDAFQDLVDVQLENLSIQRGLKVTQESMERYLERINNATIGMTLALQDIVSGQTSEDVLRRLSLNAATLFPSSPVTGLAHGGIVTKPTFAMIGEGGEPEAIVPLSKAGQMGFGGGGGTVTIINKISLPNVRDIRDIPVPEIERLLTGKFDQAMRNLDRQGRKLPMRAKT